MRSTDAANILGIPSLWPGDESGADDMDIPFFLSDLMSAIDSNYVSIQFAADPATGDSIKQFLADAEAAVETRRMRRATEISW